MFPAYHFNSKPLVIAHRGGAGLWPENTLFALQEAAKLGADLSEIDIRMSRDGVLVAIHDEYVDRTTNAKGMVKNMTLAELRGLDAGYRWTNDGGRTFPFRARGITIPTLSDIFSIFPNEVISLEIKQNDPPILGALREVINRFDKAKNVLISAFKPPTIKTFRRLCPKIASAASDSEVIRFARAARLHLENFVALNNSAFEVPFEVITPRFIKAAHKKNKRVDVWTVNEVEDMQQLLDYGVDGIITDFPDRLLKLLEKHAAS
jgi:glycerophosphoryl diester phosphodiesterase